MYVNGWGERESLTDREKNREREREREREMRDHCTCPSESMTASNLGRWSAEEILPDLKTACSGSPFQH